MKHKKYLSSGLPKGYNTTPELFSADNPRLPPPAYIHYCEKYVSEINAETLLFIWMIDMYIFFFRPFN